MTEDRHDELVALDLSMIHSSLDIMLFSLHIIYVSAAKSGTVLDNLSMNIYIYIYINFFFLLKFRTGLFKAG